MLASALNKTFAIITLCLIAPLLMGYHLPEGLDIAILLASLTLTGIPHGAIDHIIFENNCSVKLSKRDLLLKFFTPYLVLIGITFLFWYFFPELSFWFFLLISAYHFGQSQLYYVKLTESSILKTCLYICWGIFVVSSLWFYHWDSQKSIIGSLFSWNLEEGGMVYNFVMWSFYISSVSIFGVFCYLLYSGSISFKVFLQELAVLILLYVLIRVSSLYLAFAIYFGLWHSLRVMITEYHHLNEKTAEKITITAFCKSFLPFSILSFLGIALLLLVSKWLVAVITPFMLFLVFISALTMPHAFFMQGMYKVLRSTPKAQNLNLRSEGLNII